MAKRKVAEAVADDTAAADSAQAVADAKTALDEAIATHAAAVAEHAKVTAPPSAVLGKQFLMEGSMVPVDLPHPEDGPYPRRITLNDRNYEHVHNEMGVTEDGDDAVIWVYRLM